MHNLLRSPNTALRSTLASPKQIGWQADLAQAARGNATRNPAFALFDMSWSLRADTPERLCQGNGTVQAYLTDLLRCAASLAQRYADRLVFGLLATVLQGSFLAKRDHYGLLPLRRLLGAVTAGPD